MNNMKRKTLSSRLPFAFACALLIVASCTEPRDNTHSTNSGIPLVGRYNLSESGMRYVIYREVDGGLFIINTTKDSLETELARQYLLNNIKK